MTRQSTVERDDTTRAEVPLLARAVALMGPVQVRNRGTVGGSLAHADASAELPAVALALDAELEHAGPLLVAVRFPVWPAPSGFGITKVGSSSAGFAVAGAVVALGPDRCRVVVYGIPPGPQRIPAAEEAAFAGVAEQDVAREAVRDLDPPDHLHATASTRRRLVGHAVARALVAARKERHA